jgi:hypothetical protein
MDIISRNDQGLEWEKVEMLLRKVISETRLLRIEGTQSQEVRPKTIRRFMFLSVCLDVLPLGRNMTHPKGLFGFPISDSLETEQ